MRRLIVLIIIVSLIGSILSGCVKIEEKKEFSKEDMIYFILTDRFYDGNLDNNFEVDKTILKKDMVVT